MDIDNKVNKGHLAQVDSVLSVEKDTPPQNAQSTIKCTEGAKVEHIFQKSQTKNFTQKQSSRGLIKQDQSM